MTTLDWKAFPKTKPDESKSYLCTLSIDPDSRHEEDLATVELYWDAKNGRWIDYLVMKIFDQFKVLHSKTLRPVNGDTYTDFTDGVRAWTELPEHAKMEDIQ